MAKQFQPDQGWSWLVLVAAFFCNVTFDGIIFSFGIFYVEFLQYFNEGRGLTSWTGSMISAVYGLVGNTFSFTFITKRNCILFINGLIHVQIMITEFDCRTSC